MICLMSDINTKELELHIVIFFDELFPKRSFVKTYKFYDCRTKRISAVSDLIGLRA